MNSRGGPYRHWPAQNRNGPATGRFVPAASIFSGHPVQNPRQQPQRPTETGPVQHYVSPYSDSPTNPFTSAEFAQAHAAFPVAPFQESLNTTFLTSEPVVHEGFIPAPGHEEDDIYPAFPSGFQNSAFYDDDFDTSSEECSDDERINLEAAEVNDREDDKDFSLSDDELEEDPEDMIIVDADLSEEEPVPKRGKPKTRGSRGGRRGRPASDMRGGSRTIARRGRKPGTRGRPKGRQGPRPVADPGPEFKELQRLANEAYMREEYELAKDYAEGAIKLNPEIFSAHSILSEIYAAMGDEQMSIWALIVGAPTKRDKELWWLILDRVERLDPAEYPGMTKDRKLKIGVLCLTSIISLDSNDFSARKRKLDLEAQRERYSSCVKLCQKMLKIQPHDSEILSRMAQLGTKNAKQTRLHLSRIIDSYDFAISHYIGKNDHDNSGLDWSLLNIYLDLLDKARDYNRALSRLKTLSRWIQKRQSETYWNDLDDDREFDVEDGPRRIAIPEFRDKMKKRRGNYGKGLPLEIRIKMGLFRLRSTPPNFDEAMRHLSMLEPEDESEGAILYEYADLFRVVADTLHMCGHDKHALRFYEPLYRQELEQHLKSFIGMYTCYRNLGDTESAEKMIPFLTSWETESLEELTILAKFFEDHGMHVESMQRAEIVFRNRNGWRLKKIGFQRYEELRVHFLKLRKQARGKHGVRKSRVKKYMSKLKAATRDEVGYDQEGNIDERPSLGPLKDRPNKGLFRTKERLTQNKPQTFMPVESETLEGTNVPLTAIDHRIFRTKLEDIAFNYVDELTAARAQHRQIIASFTRLEKLCDDADEGDISASFEYMSIARELIEEFSTFDIFYSDRRQAFRGYFRRLQSGDIWKESALMILAVEANRIEDGEEGKELKERPETIPEDFYGVHFDQWVGAYSYDIEICRLACALAVDDSPQVSAAVRYLLKVYPFGTEIFRLYSVANRLCSIASGYATGPTSKALMRYIKTIDYALLSPENRAWYNFKGDDRTQWMQHTLNSGLRDQVKGHDPALFVLFGYICMSGGTYTAALNYFFRAFAITPEDPVLNLSIGVAYFQHALKRMSENRQYQIQQGIAFMNRYYDLRTKVMIAIHIQEAEFNVGRVYHGLGLVTQAIPYYQRCVALSEIVRQEASMNQDYEYGRAEDFATEAAFALQAIYVLSGDFKEAYNVTKANLVID
ncbi:transcription factor TFIIIC subunit tfc4 [Kalmusia sp. IMI 367209]|nr:transcription factor TFIIIC subunit tfc4 [Kalmusia sp. IMI 367209]